MKEILFQKGTTEELESIVVETIRSELNKLPKESVDVTRKIYGTRKEVANSLHISLPTLNQLTKNGILIGYRLQGRVLYKWSEVDQALEKITPLKHSRAQ